MGIIVSWINSALWPNGDSQLSSDSDSSSASSSSGQEVSPSPSIIDPTPVDKLVLAPIPRRLPSPSLKPPITTPAVASLYTSMMPVTSYFDDIHMFAPSSMDSMESSAPSTPRAAHPSLIPTGSSPPLPADAAAHVNLPHGSAEHGLDRETDTVMFDVGNPAIPYSSSDTYAEALQMSSEEAGAADLCFDDDASLSALERIYLFSRSTAAFHRQVASPRCRLISCGRYVITRAILFTQSLHCALATAISTGRCTF